jgi:hypothetical protein
MATAGTPPPFSNPYKPGAGHMPPYLAGRVAESAEFVRLLEQDTILENLVLTGLRGVGKTVLLETFRPKALAAGWLWVGADLSEAASISEQNLATRLITDLSVVTSQLILERPAQAGPGFSVGPEIERVALDYVFLNGVFEQTPGLVVDKLKAVLMLASKHLADVGKARVVFAYDEAQNLSDHAERDQYPLSVLLDVFQSIQRSGCQFMLALTGLPTLFGKLVDARTYAERMFRVVTLDRLTESESRDAVTKPVKDALCPVSLSPESVETVVAEAGGYPYFIQFMCREVYDVFLQQLASDGSASSVPVDSIQRKLDTDFFAGRWARATDRQRHLMYVVSHLPRVGGEFAIQEVVELGKRMLRRPFSASHVNQILGSLSDQGLIYKNRFGKYSLAVPLMDRFILRNYELPPDELNFSSAPPADITS